MNTFNGNLKEDSINYNNIICNNHYSSNQMNYILLDLRVSPENASNDSYYDVKPGFLPMTVILDQNELRDQFVSLKLNSTFILNKAIRAICSYIIKKIKIKN